MKGAEWWKKTEPRIVQQLRQDRPLLAWAKWWGNLGWRGSCLPPISSSIFIRHRVQNSIVIAYISDCVVLSRDLDSQSRLVEGIKIQVLLDIDLVHVG